MDKKTSFSTQGTSANIGELSINRILPNRYADAVGPFVFLDHIVPQIQNSLNKEGTGAHPHRGIATLSYVMEGEDEHFDSQGNYAKVNSGGVQWMNAGNGIIHDETLNPDSKTSNKTVHAFQFWINLPSGIKNEKPAYMSIEGDKVPVQSFENGEGWLKVIAGTFNELKSEIPAFSEQFIYHVRLEPEASFRLFFLADLEVGALLPSMPALLNGEKFNLGDFIEFDRSEGSIELQNNNKTCCDFLIFGGEHYSEPIFAEGPFVMNSKLDIANAYKDYFNGGYGLIDYERHRQG